MTPAYAITLVAGVVLLLLWIAALAVSEIVAGWERVDPEARFGRGGRFVVAGLTGFGLAGMSSTYAGWPDAAALAAAVAGAGAVVAVSALLADVDRAGPN